MTFTPPPPPSSDLASKLSWLPGPWQKEADRAEWRRRGIACLITRSDLGGNLCGYVAVPPGHRWHGRPGGKVPASAHGGITYSAKCAGHICHVPLPGESDDVWWIGFDCAHAWDFQPLLATRLKAAGSRLGIFDDAIYRDWDYVRAEVEGLAQQVHLAKRGPRNGHAPTNVRKSDA